MKTIQHTVSAKQKMAYMVKMTFVVLTTMIILPDAHAYPETIIVKPKPPATPPIVYLTSAVISKAGRNYDTVTINGSTSMPLNIATNQAASGTVNANFTYTLNAETPIQKTKKYNVTRAVSSNVAWRRGQDVAFTLTFALSRDDTIKYFITNSWTGGNCTLSSSTAYSRQGTTTRAITLNSSIR